MPFLFCSTFLEFVQIAHKIYEKSHWIRSSFDILCKAYFFSWERKQFFLLNGRFLFWIDIPPKIPAAFWWLLAHRSISFQISKNSCAYPMTVNPKIDFLGHTLHSCHALALSSYFLTSYAWEKALLSILEKVSLSHIDFCDSGYVTVSIFLLNLPGNSL